METELVRYRDEEGVRAAFVQRGHKWVKIVTIDSPISCVKRHLEEERYFSPLLLKGQPYPVARARRLFLEAGRRLGISDTAKAIVKAAGVAS